MKHAHAQAEKVLRLLAQSWPDAQCELIARDPWDLLVAVILSARTSDDRVNQVMAVLTEHYVGPEAFADMDPRELELHINRVPLYQNKARYIVESARMIVYRLGGEVPNDMETLQTLPGVGRKTAAVVLGNAFKVPAVAADVHVQRVVQRLAWSANEDPKIVEQAVMDLIPRESWVVFCHQLIRLGREACRPKHPWCSRCPLQELCPQQGVEGSR